MRLVFTVNLPSAWIEMKVWGGVLGIWDHVNGRIYLLRLISNFHRDHVHMNSLGALIVSAEV